MPPLRGYTMGMIRRRLAFPLRARNKAAGGRAKEGRGAEGGLARRRPLGPRLLGRSPGTAGMGAGSLKSSDSERLQRAPGHSPEQVLPQAVESQARPPPAPSLPGRKLPLRTRRVGTQPGFWRRCPRARN